jgi:hypothetical protein
VIKGENARRTGGPSARVRRARIGEDWHHHRPGPVARTAQTPRKARYGCCGMKSRLAPELFLCLWRVRNSEIRGPSPETFPSTSRADIRETTRLRSTNVMGKALAKPGRINPDIGFRPGSNPFRKWLEQPVRRRQPFRQEAWCQAGGPVLCLRAEGAQHRGISTAWNQKSAPFLPPIKRSSGREPKTGRGGRLRQRDGADQFPQEPHAIPG